MFYDLLRFSLVFNDVFVVFVCLTVNYHLVKLLVFALVIDWEPDIVGVFFFCWAARLEFLLRVEKTTMLIKQLATSRVKQSDPIRTLKYKNRRDLLVVVLAIDWERKIANRFFFFLSWEKPLHKAQNSQSRSDWRTAAISWDVINRIHLFLCISLMSYLDSGEKI